MEHESLLQTETSPTPSSPLLETYGRHPKDPKASSSFEVLETLPNPILPRHPGKNERLWDVDLLRGLVMILLAIEHTYDNFMGNYDPYRDESWWNDAYWDGTPVEFFTSQVSRPSTSGFFLLMGMGMSFLFDSRSKIGWANSKILHFFVVRGIMLMFIQLICLTSYQAYIQLVKHHPSSVIGGSSKPLWVIELGSLWGLGISMIVTSIILVLQNSINKSYCLLLPPITIMEGRWGNSLVVILIILCMVFTKISIPENFVVEDFKNSINPLVGVLIVPGYYYYSSNFPALYTQYTLLPWLGVVLLGVLVGQRLLNLREKAYTLIGLMSGLMLFGFLFFQVMCFYGFTCIGNFRKFSKKNYYSFWCFSKYPPDLVFLLWTVGLNLTFLCLIHKTLFSVHKKWMFTPLKVFGATSLCFFTLHILLGTLLAAPFPQGLSDIGWLYLEWVVLLYVTYPFCSAYLLFKQHQRKDSFWRYL